MNERIRYREHIASIVCRDMDEQFRKLLNRRFKDRKYRARIKAKHIAFVHSVAEELRREAA